MKRVTVAGLGIIGSAWAQNLHADGLEVRGWNRSPKDVPFYESDLAAVESLLDVIVPVLKSGQMVVQSSTISARWTKEFAARVEATGAVFVEAPFTGSKPAAEARKTVFYFGGPTELVEKARTVLDRLSGSRLHVGGIGTASTLKLAMNLNLGLMMEALSESLTLARGQGISDEKYFEALHMNVGRSGLSDLKEPKLRDKDYAPQFSLKHMNKDLRLALETAQGIDLPAAKSLKSFYDKGMDSGLGEDDFIGVIRLLGKSSGK
jgi:3-hydroxyisobutyrate dehydrogenase-like beta-hydroxyacid dehydrogenase